MRCLSVLVIGLAAMLAFSGVTEARNHKGNKRPLILSQFSAPLVYDLGAEVPSSLAEINSRGEWSLTTTGLTMNTEYDICLDAFAGPGPVLLKEFNPGDSSDYSTGPNTATTDANGDWQAPRFQVLKQDGDVCLGTLVQESGITIDGSGVSKFSAPFVAAGGSGEVESTSQISSSGGWILATSGLERRQRYDICFDAEVGPPIIGLADLKSEGSGDLFAKGNAYTRNDEISTTWQAPRLQIMEEPYPNANDCEGLLVQETGLTIKVP